MQSHNLQHVIHLMPILFYVQISVIETFSVPSPPFIFKQPPRGNIYTSRFNGVPINLECQATGEPEPSYEWFKNGSPFTPTLDKDPITNQSLGIVLTDHTRGKIDRYQCFAENKYGRAMSNSVTINKVNLREFKDVFQRNLTVFEGQPLKLECGTPRGSPTPDLHWLRLALNNDTVKPINNPRITADPTGHLWFSNVTRSDMMDEYPFTCLALSTILNDYKIGNRYFLNVIPIPVDEGTVQLVEHELVLQYVSSSVVITIKGKSTELYCIYGGTPLPQVIWRKNGLPVETSRKITFENFGKTLIIKKTDYSDAGIYSCEVSNGLGRSKSHMMVMQVLSKPYFKKAPENVVVGVSDTVEISCEALGVPEIHVQWTYNTKPLHSLPLNPRHTIEPNKLVIKNVQLEDTGNYGCNASNYLSYIYKDVYVNVLAISPRIVVQTDKNLVEALEWRDAILPCRIFAAPKPKIQWTQDGKELPDRRFSIQPNGDLQIITVQLRDKGIYSCLGINMNGNISTTTNLEVRVHTRIVHGPVDVKIPIRGNATFRCDPTADPSLALEISWLKNGEVATTEDRRISVTSDYSLLIVNASESDAGNYTCAARTALDEVTVSAQLYVEEVPQSPEIIVVDCSIKYATVHWKSKETSKIGYYSIEYNNGTAHNEWTVYCDAIPREEMSFDVDLAPWGNYSFRVVAHNEVGDSRPSLPSNICRTKPDVPSRHPTNVRAEGSGNDTLIVTWEILPEICHNGPDVKYHLYWKKDIASEDYNKDIMYYWTQDTFSIENLVPRQRYRMYLVAVNKIGVAPGHPREIVAYAGQIKPRPKSDQEKMLI